MGWAFKANTNDSRETPAKYVAFRLLEAGALLHVFDPMVEEDKIRIDLHDLYKNTGKSKDEIDFILKNIEIMETLEEAISEVKAICVLTEWEVFKNYDWGNRSNPKAKIFDGRRIISKTVANLDRI